MIKHLTKGIVTASIAAFSLLSMSFAVHTITFTPVSDSSTVAFKIKNLGTKVDGTLGNLKGTIVFDPANMAKAKIEATVDVSTINTGIGARNKHLQAEEYFNAEKYPQIKISSTSITIIDEAAKKAHMDGTLTIKGKEKPCSLDFIYSKSEKGYNLKSDFTVNRKDFGVGSKKTRIMKDKVEVSLDINVE